MVPGANVGNVRSWGGPHQSAGVERDVSKGHSQQLCKRGPRDFYGLLSLNLLCFGKSQIRSGPRLIRAGPQFVLGECSNDVMQRPGPFDRGSLGNNGLLSRLNGQKGVGCEGGSL